MRTWVPCLLILTGLGVFTCLNEIFIIDLQPFTPKSFPSDEYWKKYLDEHRKEVFDGESDTTFLNSCYLGGWNRCFTRYANNLDFMPWNFYLVQKEYPLDLGGNMTDTERIAGQLGWKEATNKIEAILINTSEAELRSRIFCLNKRLVLVWGIGMAVIILFVLQNSRKGKTTDLGVGT